jgi:murein L,D-transpeptidase YcbB/YkuD
MIREYRGLLALPALLLGAGLIVGDLPVGSAAAAAPPDAQAELTVSLSDRTLHVTQGGETIATYEVAIGKDGHETPTGTFRIRRIVWNPSWTPPPDAEWARDKKPTPPGDPNNPMGRVKIFFAEPDYYIHGTTDESSVGSAASHGCLRMKNDDVVELARLVMEHGGEAREAGWFRRILNRIRDTQEVRLSSPVPIRVTA